MSVERLRDVSEKRTGFDKPEDRGNLCPPTCRPGSSPYYFRCVVDKSGALRLANDAGVLGDYDLSMEDDSFPI
jgi:hypothetical protein